MSDDASSHTMTIVSGVQFEVSLDVIVELLKITCILEASIEDEWMHDVIIFVTSIGLIDPHVEGDD